MSSIMSATEDLTLIRGDISVWEVVERLMDVRSMMEYSGILIQREINELSTSATVHRAFSGYGRADLYARLPFLAGEGRWPRGIAAVTTLVLASKAKKIFHFNKG